MIPKKTAESGEIDAGQLEDSYRGRRHLEREQAEQATFERPNFRKVRRSRDTPVTFRVFRETLEDIQRLAKAENIPMVQVLERAIALYKNTMSGQRSG